MSAPVRLSSLICKPESEPSLMSLPFSDLFLTDFDVTLSFLAVAAAPFVGAKTSRAPSAATMDIVARRPRRA